MDRSPGERARGRFSARGAADREIIRSTDVEIASEPLIGNPVAFMMEGTVGRSQVVPGGPVALESLPPGRYRIVATHDGVTFARNLSLHRRRFRTRNGNV